MKQVHFSIIALFVVAFFFAGCNKKCDTPTPVTVDAGADQNVITSTVSLSGTVTSGSTSNMTYLWTAISGPSVPIFSTSSVPAFSNNPSVTTTTATNLVAGTYILQFQATNNAGSTGIDTMTVVVNLNGIKTLTIQPGVLTGQDAEVDYVPGLYDGNGKDGTAPFFRVMDWTYGSMGAGEGWYRSYLKFTALDTLPAGTQIASAKLTLYGIDSFAGFWGNSTYAGSPYTPFGDNTCVLDRVTGNWDQSTITWNTKPGVTTTDEVIVPPSTSRWDYTTTDLDVTQLVKDMIATPGTNFGFCMRLQTEAYYKEIAYSSSEAAADSSTGPKLVITYK
jgi:hypothetical protein